MSDMGSSLAPRQLVLALDHSDWPDRIVAMIGPEGSGKSHLAAIWADVTGARVLSAKLLPVTDLPSAFVTGALVLEDPSSPGQNDHEECKEKPPTHRFRTTRDSEVSSLSKSNRP